MRRKIIFCVAFAVAAPMAAWQRTAIRAAYTRGPSGADLADGKLIYSQKCEACHFSTSGEKKIGPGLAGLMKHAKFKNGMTADDNDLRRVIERGGKDMPGFRDSLKQKQVRDLIAYVKTL